MLLPRINPLRRFCTPSLIAIALILPASVPALHAQALPTAPASGGSVQDRSKALNAVFHDYWEQSLKNSPELASSIGDKRYNDQVSDYSVRAINQWLEAEQNFLLQLAAIDATGLSDQEKTSPELLIRHLADDHEAYE